MALAFRCSAACPSSSSPLSSQLPNIGSGHRPVAPPTVIRDCSTVRRARSWRCHSRAQKNFDHIPKQFREENLLDGLMDNYENVPESMYGLTPQLMSMFSTKDNILTRQAAKVTEDSITSARFYDRFAGFMDGKSESESDEYSQYDFDMRATMYRNSPRSRSRPPDLPSLLLDARIVYLGMPLYEAVTELIVAEIMWLSFEDSSKPIYLYINSSGTEDENMELVGFETEAFAIADTMDFCPAKVHTLNLSMAFGEAAMLLAKGAKGHRLMLPHSLTALYLPKTYKSFGTTTDMWIAARDLQANTETLLELLAEGVGKPKEEIANDIRRVRYFSPQEAIDYGIADKIIDTMSDSMDRQHFIERNQKAAMRKAAKAAKVFPGAAPTRVR